MRHRSHDKIVMGRHSMIHRGLRKILEKIADWDEVANIQVNETKKSRTKSRKGGHSLRVTRPFLIGTKQFGFKCVSTQGTSNQEVVITAAEGQLEALESKLITHGYLKPDS